MMVSFMHWLHPAESIRKLSLSSPTIFNITSNLIYAAPFAVNLNANDQTFVEPDISVICDPDKLSDRGCEGAPDLVIEVVSPSSRRMDYIRKMALYADAGVREYWIVDPATEQTTLYRFEETDAPAIIPFNQDIPVGIYKNLQINIADLLQ